MSPAPDMAGQEMARLSGQRASEIAESIERAIAAGALPPESRLPTVRSLAEQLDVSPTTVAAAYRTLRQRGVISTHGRGGSRVHPSPPVAPGAAEPVPAGLVDLAGEGPDPQLVPDRSHLLDHLARPIPLVHPEGLFDVLGKDLEIDGLPAGSLAVANSSINALDLLLATRLRPGDRIALEDPCPGAVRDLVNASGYLPVPVETDSGGVVPESLARVLEGTTPAVVFTSRGAEARGTAHDAERSRELAQVIRCRPGALVIERDPLWRISGTGLNTALGEGLDSWASIRSYGAALGPDLDLTAVLGDPTTVARFRGRQKVTGSLVSPVITTLVLELLGDSSVDRTIDTAVRTYAARRVTLLAGLEDRGMSPEGASGLGVWLPVRDESRVVELMSRKGWNLAPGSRFSIEAPPAVRISTSRLHAHEARELADDLLEALAA